MSSLIWWDESLLLASNIKCPIFSTDVTEALLPIMPNDGTARVVSAAFTVTAKASIILLNSIPLFFSQFLLFGLCLH